MTAASSLMLVIALLAVFIMAAFLAVYLYDRTQKAAMWWLCGFLIGFINPICEFIIPYVDDPRPFLLLISLSFVTMLGFQAIGISIYYNKKIPVRLVLGTIAVGAIVWVAILDMPRDTLLRNVLHQSPYLAMQCVSIWLIARVRPRSKLDNVFLAVLVFGAVHYASRPILAMVSGGVGQSAKDYLATQYATYMLIWIAVVVLSTSTLMFMLLLRNVLVRLSHQSMIDPLSGLYNRRGLDEAFQRHSRELERNGSNDGYCVTICDVDRFKLINDTFGHDVGDKMIIKMGHYLEEQARLFEEKEGHHCVVARMGGEEFAIVVWGITQSEAAYRVDLLRKGFGAIEHRELGGRRVTVSIGVAGSKTGQGFRDVMMAADAALYKAKQNGRDRVESASGMRRKSEDLIRKWEKQPDLGRA